MKSERELFFVSLFTFITVLSWVTFELVKTSKTTTIPSTVQELIVPLTPGLDTDTLNILLKKE